MNTILFYRILTVDFSAMFKSASFSPAGKDSGNKTHTQELIKLAQD